MRVCIYDLTLFDCGDHGIYVQLQRLFARAAIGQHQLDIADPEHVISSNFMQVACATTNRLEWEELISRTTVTPFATTITPARCAVVSNTPVPGPANAAFRLTPSQIGEWAEQPLRVLLENDRDTVLLLLAARVSSSNQLSDALREGWLKPDGRGGTGEVGRAVQSSGTNERIAVLIDSDRDDPSVVESRKAASIRADCALADIPIHVLRRRELENYVPESAWSLLLSRSRPSTSPRRAKGRDERAALIYRRLIRTLESSQEDIVRKYGQDAFDTVLKALQPRAERKSPNRLLHELFKEWRDLPIEEKAVDDLKVRFGDDLAEKAVQLMRNVDLTWLEQDVIAELTAIATMLEDWL